MNQDEHQSLVKIVRDVHSELRKAYVQNDGDLETVWQKHLSSEEQREAYSNAVYKLATKKWTTNDSKDSRIQWCYKTCLEYFFHGGLQRAIGKDMRCAMKIWLNDATKFQNTSTEVININEDYLTNHVQKLILLDVGSCYNPFAEFEKILAVPVDLTPATDDVSQCDFMHLKVREDIVLDSKFLPSGGPITELPSLSFHVVVFSLLLEYLPAPSQRFLFCKKAWKLLMKNGILLIVTPDSKSQNYNSPMMKSWRTAIESLGFKRYKYEKLQHLHCMAYRKNVEVSPFADTSDDSVSNLMYIPQDFKIFSELSEYVDRSSDQDVEVKISFDELPLDV